MSERTIWTVLEQAAHSWGEKPALHQPEGKSHYRTYTWAEYCRIAREIACGLHAAGIRRGDVVALYSETRAEFYLADLGIMSSGAIAAALYTSYPLPDQIHNLRASEARMIFAENSEAMRALQKTAGAEGLAVHWVLLTGSPDGDQEALTLAGLREMGARAMEEDPGLFERIRDEVHADDPAILYLTSGATGEPKMGLTSHHALVSNIDMAPVVLPVTPDDCTIAFLPSAHIAQRVVVELVPVRMGCSVWFSEGLSKMPAEFRRVRPTFFLAPPRVWERVYASVTTEVKKRGALARRLFYTSLGLGMEAARLKQQGKTAPVWMSRALKIADRLVFSKIRSRLGGRLRIAASGAAPLGKDLAEFYSAIGMPLIEGYGLTEGGVVSLNPLARPKPGSIGTPLPNVELWLAEDGELLVKSPCLFLGYYKDPASTAMVLRDGWLYTGDIAELDADGYVYITGRKKELIVSSNGKKIYPSRIETLFKLEPVINQVVLVGDRLPYVTALVTVNAANAETLPGMETYKGRDVAEIVTAKPVQEAVQSAFAKVNRELADFERVRRFRILGREFTIESGELTPTMKVRRGRVLENYRDVVSELYMGREESS